MARVRCAELVNDLFNGERERLDALSFVDNDRFCKLRTHEEMSVFAS
mgnify:CR=1 FL=1